MTHETLKAAILNFLCTRSAYRIFWIHGTVVVGDADLRQVTAAIDSLVADGLVRREDGHINTLVWAI